MKHFLIFSTLAISVFARPQQTKYGIPDKPAVSTIGNSLNMQQFSNQFVSNSGGPMVQGMDGPKVYKHISIHVAPEEEFETPMKRVIRPMEKPDKIVNIIFVKAPSHSYSQQTEVILPEQPETRTVVYVLLRKSAANSGVKIRQPPAAKLSKPEVFFIKYGKTQEQSQSSAGESTGSTMATGGYESSAPGPSPSTPGQAGYQ